MSKLDELIAGLSRWGAISKGKGCVHQIKRHTNNRWQDEGNSL